jgi:hypothetical protein
MLELFRGTLKVHAGDFDNWEGWGPYQGSINNDGDFLKLTIGSGYNYASVSKIFPSFSTGTYKYANIRVTELTGSQFELLIRRADTQQWISAGVWNTPGVKENIQLNLIYNGNIDGVGVAVHGSPGQYVVIDYVVISDKKRRDPVAEGNCIDIKVHLGVTEEVDSFSASLWNKGGIYTGTNLPLDVGNHVKIYGAREGDPLLKLFTGRVETLAALDKGSRGNILTISGRSYGEELMRKTVFNMWENVKGEDIVKSIIENYTSLKHVRGSTELVESTDTTFTFLRYDDVNVFEILKEIAAQCDKNGVIGYDFRITHDGKFEFFQRGSRTSPVSLQDLIEEAEWRKEIYRLRHRVTVYGKALSPDPADRDAWTEGDTVPSGWASNGTGSFSMSDDAKVGTRSVKLTGTSRNTLWAQKNITPQVFGGIGGARELKFWFKYDYSGASQSASVSVRLLAGGGKVMGRSLLVSKGEWREYALPLGPKTNWNSIGGATWNDTYNAIAFYVELLAPADYVYLWVDGLHLDGYRYGARVTVSPTPAEADIRELTVVDDELLSDYECSLRAKALLDAYVASETLQVKTSVLAPGGNRLLPGDTITVNLPDENINASFRIKSVEHYFDGRENAWICTLELGREKPMLADYLYHLKAKTERLARSKLSR